jgi:hypothetical protein
MNAEIDRHMERLILLLFALLAIAILADSEMAQLSGNEGLALLESLANVSSNLTEANNTTINLSHSSNLTELGGENVSDWWKNLSQSSDNLTSWGSEPRRSPGPPSESDIRTARMAKIIRDNHLA